MRNLDACTRAASPPRAERRAPITPYVIALYVIASVAVTLQRGVLGPEHNVFKIFRQSFWHLLAGRNLYAPYPTEQGGAPADLFKYSPTAALLFAPIAIPTYTWALLGWSLLGALFLYRALTLVLEPQRATLAALIVLPDLVAAMQACSSNAIIAALMIFSYAALERRLQLRGAVAIVAGASIKLFPLAALTFAVFHPRQRRFAVMVIGVCTAAFLLPLVVTPAAQLMQQYRWWYVVERSDAADLAFGLSAMSLVRHWIGGAWPNWPMQLAATLALILPLHGRRELWRDPEFRLGYLASILMYVVLFNHQAERPSFVIASAGIAIWCVTPPRGTTALWARTLLGLSAVVGLRTLPVFLVWTVAQLELWGWRARVPHRLAEIFSPHAARLPRTSPNDDDSMALPVAMGMASEDV